MAQLPVTEELRLGCPAYVCGGGPGVHTASGWSGSSPERRGAIVPRAWLVKWPQPSGRPGDKPGIETVREELPPDYKKKIPVL